MSQLGQKFAFSKLSFLSVFKVYVFEISKKQANKFLFTSQVKPHIALHPNNFEYRCSTFLNLVPTFFAPFFYPLQTIARTSPAGLIRRLLQQQSAGQVPKRRTPPSSVRRRKVNSSTRPGHLAISLRAEL